VNPDTHLRGLHYRLLNLDPTPYDGNWEWLRKASARARDLGLVEPWAFRDKRTRSPGNGPLYARRVSARRPPDQMGREWVPVLKEIPLFSGISTRHLRGIDARTRRYGPGDVIVREGDPGNAMYVILDGAVRVEPPRGRAVTLKAGSYFGEMSLLDGAPRAAAIRAVGDVTTMMISRGAFTKLLRREPQIAKILLRTLAGRLRAAHVQY
jgi:cyclic nucleotide-binding protein